MTGKLTGVGVGPGDSGLLTLLGARAIADAGVVFAPKAPGGDSLALAIARSHVSPGAEIVVLEYEMTAGRERRSAYWREAAVLAAEKLSRGVDMVFLTIGDPLLYSTWIYFMREVRALLPDAPVSTVAGVSAVSAAAALSGIPLGEGGAPLVIVPGGRNLDLLERALDLGGTVAVMKLGKRLAEVVALLARRGLLERSTLSARVGFDGERVVRGLAGFSPDDPGAGDMAVLLIDAGKP
ncbi:MAG: precorrin-2 C(20)-methyltransferase [Planctomycetota bacterium]|jgi:precorrin-2/cobalt-factor-2 C20-methyltransferase|nr:precorrin-2 C(20)-methyltransferase [Planctomycetota bacterium]